VIVKYKSALILYGMLLLIITFSFVIQLITNTHWVYLGIKPRSVEGLLGIIGTPFVHSDWEHLINNLLSLAIGLSITVYYYKELVNQVFIYIWIMGGLMVWLFGRDAYHVGASGLVYGIIGFILFSGLFRGEKRAIALALLIIFLNQGFIIGLLPLQKQVSYEAHLYSLTTGAVLAYYFRNDYKQIKDPHWNDQNNDNGTWNYQKHIQLETNEKEDKS